MVYARVARHDLVVVGCRRSEARQVDSVRIRARSVVRR
jgi:hypothetical protein